MTLPDAAERRKRQIAAEMARVRARTLRLLELVPVALWNCRVHDFYSPIGWHFGHIGMTEEYWTCGQALGLPPLDADRCFLFANIPENPKDNRVHLPAPEEVVDYLLATRRQALDALDTADIVGDEPLLADGYAWEFAIQHECQHQETIAELLQLIRKHQGEHTATDDTPINYQSGSHNQASADTNCVPEGHLVEGPLATEFIPSFPPVWPPSLGGRGARLNSANTSGGTGSVCAPAAYRHGSSCEMVKIPGGAFQIGSDDRHGYDNEKPAHTVEIAPFELAQNPVTAGDWLRFIDADGYNIASHWSEAGWEWRTQCDVCLPEYWLHSMDAYRCYAASGIRAIDPDEPVTSLSWFEADAYARWAGLRLPTEAEWEYAATLAAEGAQSMYPWGDDPEGAEQADCELRAWQPRPVHEGPVHEGPGATGRGPGGSHQPSATRNQEPGTSHQPPATSNQQPGTRNQPRTPDPRPPLKGMAGGAWEWTSSPFLPYPGFIAFPYDGYSEEHMDGCHYVCRGGSWATDRRILRAAFRNWYVPTYRQGFLGMRCAR